MKVFSNDKICVERITVGVINTNCYILYTNNPSGQHHNGCVIDPGADAEKIMAFLDENGIVPEAVFLTHGHFDHMEAADELRKKYGVKVYIGEKDYDLALSPDANCSDMFDEIYSFRADDKLRDNDEVSFAGASAKVMETPGHTAGCICFYLKDEKLLFSGDTLFYASSGRTDLATGSPADMQESLEKLFKMDDDIKVLPGHGAGTSIGREKLRGGGLLVVRVYVRNDIYDQDIRGLLEVYLGQIQMEYYRTAPDDQSEPDTVSPAGDIYINNESLTDMEPSGDNYRLLIEIKSEGVSVRFIGYSENTIDISSYIPYERSIGNPMREEKNAVKLAVYRVLEKAFKRSLPWGDLIGVRPVKLAVMMEKEGLSREQTVERLIRDYGISPEKGALASRVAAKELSCVKGLTGDDRYSLYIGIPFCPTRCLYCSFTSYPIRGNEDMIEPYLAALKKEICATALKCGNRKPVSVYMGGGTPSSISAKQLYELIIFIKERFGIDDDTEFTVEAGRPDSIDKDKLTALKTSGISRISINPQTMKDETLRLMGRTHTFKDIEDCYETALSAGLSNINMDLIMGLPGENIDDAAMSIRKVMDLKPAGITVHTLSLKKNSPLTLGLSQYDKMLPGPAQISEMVENSRQMLAMGGYEEYYVYRQKNIGANLENTGYALPGYECLYNILMMEELQTIVACGASVVTKLVYDTENMGLSGNKSIRRIDNLKNLKEYIGRIDEVIARKDILDSLWMKDM